MTDPFPAWRVSPTPHHPPLLPAPLFPGYSSPSRLSSASHQAPSPSPHCHLPRLPPAPALDSGHHHTPHPARRLAWGNQRPLRNDPLSRGKWGSHPSHPSSPEWEVREKLQRPALGA
ncbi:hypothetical protein P7K49_020977 [Saguinus oedipus]|uniref:Uncharacterized protein n=1 Tax=Saguinus oedipus TaxID=9490 RepID=A0ABQ9URB4_SAGOE|nr:hypothetical protein P7K49_020977 [Saguinus oedipus]